MDLRKIDIDRKLNELESIDDFKIMISTYLQDDEFMHVWEAVRSKGDIIRSVKSLLKNDVADVTLNWRIKKILSWGKGLGLIENKRYQYNK